MTFTVSVHIKNQHTKLTNNLRSIKIFFVKKLDYIQIFILFITGTLKIRNIKDAGSMKIQSIRETGSHAASKVKKNVASGMVQVRHQKSHKVVSGVILDLTFYILYFLNELVHLQIFGTLHYHF